MPELPEVEVTRRHLEVAMSGRKVTRARVGHPRTARNNDSAREVEGRLEGRVVLGVRRHGKFLLAELDDGSIMVSHLGMSGRYALADPGHDLEPHTHLIIDLDDGTQVRFVDPRTFGFVAVMDHDELRASGVGRLGRDAWTDPPSPEDLVASLANRTAPIKALLLDQGPVAGLGNIYADEALHRARIHPLVPGRDLTISQAAALVSAVRVVLEDAIARGGTTLDDMAYLIPDGSEGDNSGSLEVYGREGLACPRCGSPIRRIVVRARSTHFCPGCQPAEAG